MGESSFWYRPTRVVPDQRPLNGRCFGLVCACVCLGVGIFRLAFCRFLVFTLHALRRCGLLLYSVASFVVCLSVGHSVSLAGMPELIRVPFGRQSCVDPRNVVLDVGAHLPIWLNGLYMAAVWPYILFWPLDWGWCWPFWKYSLHYDLDYISKAYICPLHTVRRQCR